MPLLALQTGYSSSADELSHDSALGIHCRFRRWWCFQGTFLKEAIGKDLEAMGSHEALNKASDKVRAMLPHWLLPLSMGTAEHVSWRCSGPNEPSHVKDCICCQRVGLLRGVGCLLQIRDTYSMVVSAKADYLKEHPELDKESTGGAEVSKQQPSDTDGRSLTRKLSRSRASFKWDSSRSAIPNTCCALAQALRTEAALRLSRELRRSLAV